MKRQRCLSCSLLLLTGVLLLVPGGALRAADRAGPVAAASAGDSALWAAPRSQVRDWWTEKSPDEKVVATNLAVAGFITAWGLAFWDYGSQSAHGGSEEWFGQNTGEGGADKAGHLYTGYVLGRAFSGLFRRYGYDEARVARAGALGSLAATTYMEIGDSFSPYGFSREDMAMNIVGAGAGWLFEANPALAARFALRGEYDPFGGGSSDVLTDYDNWRYLVTVKLDGFNHMPKPLRWIEVHAGYYARNYGDADPANDQRHSFVGVGISLPKLAAALGWRRTATFLDYYQPPGTVARDDRLR